MLMVMFIYYMYNKLILNLLFYKIWS